jgi:hypothetical protein
VGLRLHPAQLGKRHELITVGEAVSGYSYACTVDVLRFRRSSPFVHSTAYATRETV